MILDQWKCMTKPTSCTKIHAKTACSSGDQISSWYNFLLSSTMTARGSLVGSKYPNKLLNTRWEMRLLSNEIFKRAQLPSVEVTILQHRLRWAGHVMRIDPSRLPWIILYGKLNEGTRPHGRPKLRYEDQLKCSLKQACTNLVLGTACQWQGSLEKKSGMV